jgi:UDP-N-acetylglucosamine 2-epimerase (non-hydrolysing)
MRYKKIIIVAGTRPNFVKAAPLLRAFKALPKSRRPRVLLLHTGQHYDYLMSKVFFEDLKIPKPDIFLDVGARTPAGQVDEIITKFQKVLAQKKPDLVMVVGDVTGTLACALAAKMSGIAVAHVEAGLRSYDDTMPEERNRVLTDHVSDLLFTSCPEGRGNLLKEGIAGKKIHFAGNVMMDTLKAESHKAQSRKLIYQLGLQKGKDILPYVLLTLHRPGNVDDPKVLSPILKAFQKIAKEVTVVFPAHPRTLKYLKAYNLAGKLKNGKSEIGNGKSGLHIVPPLGYLDFIALQQNALCVFTDSGGVQEETSFLNVPCFTVRNNTERPVTVELGTNQIIGTKPEAILEAWSKFKSVQGTGDSVQHKAVSLKRRALIPRWDGRAAERIVDTLTNAK